MIKYVEQFNFLPGDRAAYERWAAEIDSQLVESDELRRITVFENAFYTTPQRVAELEFKDLASLERYFAVPAIDAIYREWAGRCANQQSLVLRQTGGYERSV